MSRHRITLHYGHDGAGLMAPCAFVLRDWTTGESVLIDSDCDYPSVAQCFGFVPCRRCDATDGTIDCEHATASAMISRAFDWLYRRDGRGYYSTGIIGRQLWDYFPGTGRKAPVRPGDYTEIVPFGRRWGVTGLYGKGRRRNVREDNREG